MTFFYSRKLPPGMLNPDGTPNADFMRNRIECVLIDSDISLIEHEIAWERRNPVPQSERRIAKAEEMIEALRRKKAAHWRLYDDNGSRRH